MGRKAGLIIGGGLAALGIGLVVAKALGKEEEGEGNGGGNGGETNAYFEYSDLIVEPYGGPNDIRWEVTVTNAGSEAGTCHLKVYDRLRSSRGIWQNFALKSEQDVSIAPGESHTFTGAHGRSGYTYQLMAKSEAGTIMNPTSPLEFLCRCCFDTTGNYSSFATEQELNDHIAADHPEYLPMEQMTYFILAGLSWPDAFYHEHWVNPEQELYGRITHWQAEIFVGRAAEVGPINDQDFDVTGLKSEWTSVDDPIRFDMPEGWVSSGKGPCGYIPNTTVVKLSFGTDLGWGGWLDFSPWLMRIPEGALVSFEVNERRCYNWKIAGVPV